MQDGIYLAQFVVGSDHGHGVAVVRGSKVSGGDSAYWWEGAFSEVSADSVSAELVVRVHTSGVRSVFEFFNEFPLKLQGRKQGDAYQLTGTTPVAPGRTMQLNLRLLQAD